MIDPDAEIARAVDVLRRGGLVAFPTETVYGLGADAANPAAVRRIFEAKGRPADHPVIVHFADAERAKAYALEWPEAAERLAARFWPGPLTLILKRAPGVSYLVTGGQETVGVRVPGHPLALALLRAFGGGIAAPSANRFGRLSPTRVEDVIAEIGPAVEIILDGGPCPIGVESTIVDHAGVRPAVLRPGKISAGEVSATIGVRVLRAGGGSGADASAGATRAPGTLEVHYAPRTPLELVPPARLESEVARALASGGRVAVLARREQPASLASRDLVWQAAPGEAAAYARVLYATLRALDGLGRDRIIVEAPPAEEPWVAVSDRLRRAAAAASSPARG